MKYVVKHPAIRDEAPPRGRYVMRVTNTDKNTKVLLSDETLRNEEIPEGVQGGLAGEGPYGMVGICIPIKLSYDWNSVGIEYTFQMPVSRCTTLARLEEGRKRLADYAKKKTAEEVPDIQKLLQTFSSTGKR